MKKILATILMLSFLGGMAKAQMEDFYSDGAMDMYFTHNFQSYKFLNDSAALAASNSPGLKTRFCTIGFRVRKDGEKFHFQYRHELGEYLVGWAISFVGGPKVNKYYGNMSNNLLLGGVVIGHFKGAWNVVNANNTKWGLGFDAGDFIKDSYDMASKHLVGAGVHTLFEQKIMDKLAVRADYSIGITNNIHRDAKDYTDWLPVYHRATLEFITDFEMYLGIEYLDILDHVAMHKQRRVDFKVGLRI